MGAIGGRRTRKEPLWCPNIVPGPHGLTGVRAVTLGLGPLGTACARALKPLSRFWNDLSSYHSLGKQIRKATVGHRVGLKFNSSRHFTTPVSPLRCLRTDRRPSADI